MKKSLLLVLSLVASTAVMAQTNTTTDSAASKQEPQKQLEVKKISQTTIDAAGQKALDRLNFYVQIILTAGNETKQFSKEYTSMDVLDAMLQAKESKEEPGDPETYVAEEFLQYIHNNYPQNPPYDFPDAFTPSFIAKVLRILK